MDMLTVTSEYRKRFPPTSATPGTSMGPSRLVWSHRAPSTGPRPVAFCRKKSGQELLTRWVESGQSSRVLWCHSLALLGYEFCADVVHHFLEGARLSIA